MHDPLPMHKPHDLSNLPEHVESLVDAELFMPLRQEVIQSHGERVMLEDQSRSQFMLGESFATQHARMLQILQQLDFASCRSFDGLPLVV